MDRRPPKTVLATPPGPGSNLAASRASPPSPSRSQPAVVNVANVTRTAQKITAALLPLPASISNPSDRRLGCRSTEPPDSPNTSGLGPSRVSPDFPPRNGLIQDTMSNSNDAAAKHIRLGNQPAIIGQVPGDTPRSYRSWSSFTSVLASWLRHLWPRRPRLGRCPNAAEAPVPPVQPIGLGLARSPMENAAWGRMPFHADGDELPITVPCGPGGKITSVRLPPWRRRRTRSSRHGVPTPRKGRRPRPRRKAGHASSPAPG